MQTKTKQIIFDGNGADMKMFDINDSKKKASVKVVVSERRMVTFRSEGSGSEKKDVDVKVCGEVKSQTYC